jgi:hypothetical protein
MIAQTETPYTVTTLSEKPSEPPSALELELGADGRLWARLGERKARVTIHRCFPWSSPDRYISLREGDGELALVRDPNELAPASRAALERALRDAAFVFSITRVDSIEEDFELRCFKVQTPQGPRVFQTALDSWPRETPNGGLVIEDVAGDLFAIPDPTKLDARSAELVWALVD